MVSGVSPQMRVLLPAATINQGLIGINKGTLLDDDDQREYTTHTNKKSEELDMKTDAVVELTPTQVEQWLQTQCPQRLPKVGNSLTTEYDAPSDWSETASKTIN